MYQFWISKILRNIHGSLLAACFYIIPPSKHSKCSLIQPNFTSGLVWSVYLIVHLAIMVCEPLHHALQIIKVTVRVCSKLKQAESWLFLQRKSGRVLNILRAFLIKHNIPLSLVGYEMIIVNSYPTRTCGIIFKYTWPPSYLYRVPPRPQLPPPPRPQLQLLLCPSSLFFKDLFFFHFIECYPKLVLCTVVQLVWQM